MFDPGPDGCRYGKDTPGRGNDCRHFCALADGCYQDRSARKEDPTPAEPPKYADDEVQKAYATMERARWDFQASARPGSWRKFKDLQDVFERSLMERTGEVPEWRKPLP